MRLQGMTPVAALLLCVSVVWAGDPWKEKPPADWDPEDVKKVLLDSPWVGKIWFGRPNLAGGDADDPLNSRGLNRNQAENEGVIAEAGGPPMRQPTTEGRADDPPPPRDTSLPGRPPAGRRQLILRWFSARTVGEALIRHWRMQADRLDESSESTGRMRQDLERNIQQMEARLARPRPYYEIVLSPMMLSEPNRQGLDAETFLQPRKAKNRIPPERIEFQGESVVFYFPREVDGRPTIGAIEKKVRFETRIHDRHIRVEFDLTKMVRDGVPDL